MSKNIDPSDHFKNAISSFKKSTSLDSDYYYAYGNESYVYNMLALWQFEHGQDPVQSTRGAAQAAQRATQINNKYDVPFWNAGAAYVSEVLYKYYRAEDTTESANLAAQNFDRLFSLNPKMTDAYVDYAYNYYINSLNSLSKNKNINQASFDIIQRCYKSNNGPHYGCMAVEALLLSVRGEQQHLQEQGRLAATTLSQAVLKAKTARQHAPQDPNVALAVGEVCLRASRVNIQLKQRTADELTEGLAAMEQALKLAPSWPRAQAMQGALLLLRARSERGVEKSADAQRARTALMQAIQGNPLLKNMYGDLLREAEALAR